MRVLSEHSNESFAVLNLPSSLGIMDQCLVEHVTLPARMHMHTSEIRSSK